MTYSEIENAIIGKNAVLNYSNGEEKLSMEFPIKSAHLTDKQKSIHGSDNNFYLLFTEKDLYKAVNGGVGKGLGFAVKWNFTIKDNGKNINLNTKEYTIEYIKKFFTGKDMTITYFREKDDSFVDKRSCHIKTVYEDWYKNEIHFRDESDFTLRFPKECIVELIEYGAVWNSLETYDIYGLKRLFELKNR